MMAVSAEPNTIASAKADPYRIVFMGTPEFACPCLRAVAEVHQVVAVVTQPDRAAGRGRLRIAPAVKVLAQDLGLKCIQVETLRRRAFREDIAALSPDLFVVVAFGHILSPRMLKVPRLGAINVHASLLPYHRGAAPIQWAVINGDDQSGVSVMQMDAGMDSGPVLLQSAIRLEPHETAGSLHDRLAPLGAKTLVRALDDMRLGKVTALAQDERAATYARMLSKTDGALDFSQPAQTVDRRIRGLDPWPGAFLRLRDGSSLKLFSSALAESEGSNNRVGAVLRVDDRGLEISCGIGSVWISELQRSGRRRMSAAAFGQGRALTRGILLEDI